ncbi:MAG: metalloregulator ArsR/SmtB family transcription factor [Myxococcota bacterium]
MDSGLQTSVDLVSAFADPTRMRLLALLDGHELTVAELTAITELSQSRVSTHLRRLRDNGLLQDRREGSLRYYRLQREALGSRADRLWSALRAGLDDAVLRSDAERRAGLLAARDDEGPWVESIAGRMEHHYSPGRTWEALARGITPLLSLGDVLDIGCGDGMVAQIVAPYAARYVGLDQSDKLLVAAKQRLRERSRASFVSGDMHDLPFDDESFDLALMLHVLTYTDRPVDAVLEATRVLRPGGQLVVVTLANHPHGEVVARYGHANRGFEPKELRRILKELDVQRCEITSRERRKPHFQVITAAARKRKEQS